MIQGEDVGAKVRLTELFLYFPSQEERQRVPRAVGGLADMEKTGNALSRQRPGQRQRKGVVESEGGSGRFSIFVPELSHRLVEVSQSCEKPLWPVAAFSVLFTRPALHRK